VDIFYKKSYFLLANLKDFIKNIAEFNFRISAIISKYNLNKK